MKATEIAKDLYWVGAIDWDMRNFHGYSTPRGTSYNAYLITGEKNVLIDTVKRPFFDQMIERIGSVIDAKEIDIIISNHVEMDHSSSLPLMQEMCGAEIHASRKGVEGLGLHYPGLKVEAVKDWQEMDIGNRTLTFVETPMLHWPDSMMTYLKGEGILFSMDGFGQHYASERRFDDEVDECVLMYEAAKYYANILMPFGKMFLRTLDKVKDLDIKMLATSHGIMWRKNIEGIVQSYVSWAKAETGKKAVIAYDTMWGSTQTMAKHIAEGIASKGVEVQVYRISDSDRSVIVKEILDAAAVVIGSPTLNNGMFPNVADLVVYLEGLRPKGRMGAAFGSFGWGGGATKDLRERMESGGLDMPLEDLDIQYVPDEEGRERCYRFGEEIGARIAGE